jgi:hypothetical protein
MPIRREYRWFYPIDWPQLSAAIRLVAKGRCEHCHRPQGKSLKPACAPSTSPNGVITKRKSGLMGSGRSLCRLGQATGKSLRRRQWRRVLP